MGRMTFHPSKPANSTRWLTLVNVELENASGELTEVGVGNMQARHAIKVNADGEEVFNEIFKTQSQGSSQSRTLNIPFESSLNVKIKDIDHKTTRSQYFANYAMEFPSSIIEQWVNQIEARTGVNADITLGIIGILLTLLGILFGSMNCPIPAIEIGIPNPF